MTKNDLASSSLENSQNKKPWGQKILFELLDFLKVFFIALAIWFIVNAYFFEVNLVLGKSMYPTLKNNDRIIVDKISTYWRPYQRGDIITIDGHQLDYANLDKFLVKRIIALPTETVEIVNNQILINGQPLAEEYLAPGIITTNMGGDFGKIKLKKDEYYVLGDNREHSGDSRTMGPVPLRAIKGHLIFRIYPLSSFGTVK